MKRLSKSYCALFFLFNAQISVAQIKPLQVGDAVPDVELKSIVNYDRQHIKLSELGDKLIILDFWTTTCTPCLNSFPKLDSLQKIFNGKIEILPITQQKKEEVMNLLSRLQQLKKIKRSSVVEDTELIQLFPCNTVPHVVWIKNKKVLGITGGEEITSSNIESILGGAQVSFKVKNDFIAGNNEKIMNGAARENMRATFPAGVYVTEGNSDVKLRELKANELLMSSTVTRYVEDFGSILCYNGTRILMTNMDPSTLYRVALGGSGEASMNSNNLDCDITDKALRNKIGLRPESEALIGEDAKAYYREHGVCYELKVPDSLWRRKFDIMLSDLNHYFGQLYGIEGLVEKRNKKCLALVRTGQEDKLKSKGGTAMADGNEYWLKIQNAKIGNLIEMLQKPLQMQPILVNETGYIEKVDIELNCELSNLTALNKELAKYNLKLEEKEKMTNVPVIRMKKPHHQ